jgi:hypothetical protein
MPFLESSIESIPNMVLPADTVLHGGHRPQDLIKFDEAILP